MKPLFQSKPLHLTACILLFWKGVSLIIWFLLQDSGMPEIGDGIFISTGFMSSLSLMAAAGFSDSNAFAFVALAAFGLTFLAYWVFFVMLTANRSGASVASVGLLVLCGLDLPTTAAISFNQWWSFLVCIVFHAAIFITVVLLRRSRLGVPTQLSELPDSV